MIRRAFFLLLLLLVSVRSAAGDDAVSFAGFLEVPEPATLLLVGVGLCAIGFARHRKSR